MTGALHERLLASVAGWPASDCTVLSGCMLSLVTQPVPGRQVFAYGVVILQTRRGLGACYVHRDVEFALSDLIGRDLRVDDELPLPVVIAFLDALLAEARPQPDELHVLAGSPEIKAQMRADLVHDVLARLGEGRQWRRVLLVGAVESLVRRLLDSAFTVTALDLDETVIGERWGPVGVEAGPVTAELLDGVDVAIVTGMSLGNGSLDAILESALRVNCPVVMYCESGSSLAGQLLAAGVAAVLAEHFPYYIFHGRSEIGVYYAEDG